MTRAKVLIFEEENQRAQHLKERLTAAGYDVLRTSLAGHGPIEQVAQLHPDVVLMDIGIRGKTDGVEATDIIQSKLDIPVIYVMSNRGYGQATLQRSRETGPFGYIFEPLDLQQMSSTIDVAILRNRLEKEIKEGRQWLSTVLNSIGDGVIAVDERGLITFINPIAVALIGWQGHDAVGLTLDQVFSIVEEGARSKIARVLAPGSIGITKDLESTIHATLASRGGGQLSVEITMSPLRRAEDGVKGMVLVLRDVTERRRAMEEIRRQANRAEALVQVASQLNKQMDLGVLLETVCTTTNRSLKGAGTAVFLLDQKTEIFQLRAAHSEVALLRAFGGEHFEVRRDTLESMLTRDKPVAVIQDLHTFTSLPYSDLLAKLRLHALVIAALFLHDEIMGILVSVFADNRPAISDDDVALLRGLANQASSAIENAELFEQVRMGRERQRVLAKSLVDIQEAERRHVARELHDQLGQALTGLQFMLEGVKSRHLGEDGTSSLEEIQDYVSDIMEQTREISLRLRPSMLDDLGLLPTLQWHFDRYTRQTSIRVDFHNECNEQRFPPEIETVAYRIVQEALTNVARYAAVREVYVGLSVQADALWLEVLDRGQGFDASTEVEKPTSGLSGMRERASLVGGYLTIVSFPKRGTQVIAALPLTGNVLERRQHDRQHPAGG
ncbi:MAG TPA: histidine kinase [Anaerolineales bacterium]|nr:histidine kinase [Anaerolineales bacterium]